VYVRAALMLAQVQGTGKWEEEGEGGGEGDRGHNTSINTRAYLSAQIYINTYVCS
jgi:hypothetical protein